MSLHLLFKQLKIKQIAVLMLVMLISFACEPVDYGEVPEVPSFERSYDLNLPSNIDLLTVNGSIYDESVGFKGIIVFRVKQDGAHDDFVAYETACPHDCLSKGGKINWERWMLLSECETCHSQFLLMYGGNGWPIDGLQPTNLPLKRYNTYFDGRYVIVKH